MIMNRIFRRLFNSIVHLHDRGLITTSVAIIWRRKDRHNGSIVLPLVAFHHQLMRPSDKVQAVNVGKLLSNVLSERVSSPPR